MTHSCTHRVRSYELDGNNHVNNAVYLNYLEYARMEFLSDSGFDYRRFCELGFSLFVADIHIIYHSAATVFDEITIITEPMKKRRASGIFKQSIYRGEDLLCSAEVTWACINSKGRPEALPAEFDVSSLSPPIE